MSSPKPTPESAAAARAAIGGITFVPSMMRNVAIRIVVNALHDHDRIFWADEIDLSFVPLKERSAIGTAWRSLVGAGILKRTSLTRRSTIKASKGRSVFKYRIANDERARAFLAANGWSGKITDKGEALLFPMEEIEGKPSIARNTAKKSRRPAKAKPGPATEPIATQPELSQK